MIIQKNTMMYVQDQLKKAFKEYDFDTAISYTEMTIGNLNQGQQEVADTILALVDGAYFAGTDFVLPDFIIEHDDNNIVNYGDNKFTVGKEIVREDDDYVRYTYGFVKETDCFGILPGNLYGNYLYDNFEQTYEAADWVSILDLETMKTEKRVLYKDSKGNILTTGTHENSRMVYYDVYIKKSK